MSQILNRPIAPPPVRPMMSVVDLVDETFLAYNAARLREACRLFVERSGRNLQCQAARSRETAARGQHGPSAADIQYRCEIQKVLPLLVNPACENRDRQGEPFVGQAGQLLTRILASIGLPRDHVFICNVIKCHPPNNRKPSPQEIANCLPYLKRQLFMIQPRVICALGNYASQALLCLDQPISSFRGQIFWYEGIPVVATFHPAHLLRHPEAKRLVWQDMQLVRQLLDQPRSHGSRAESIR